jgi:hypothetical protein
MQRALAAKESGCSKLHMRRLTLEVSATDMCSVLMQVLLLRGSSVRWWGAPLCWTCSSLCCCTGQQRSRLTARSRHCCRQRYGPLPC